MQEIPFDSWVGKILWRRDRLPTPVFLGFPCGSAGKESACNVGDLDSVPGLGRFPAEGKGYPHISILAWRIPMTVWFMGSQRGGANWVASIFFHFPGPAATRLSPRPHLWLFPLLPPVGFCFIWGSCCGLPLNDFRVCDYMDHHKWVLWVNPPLLPLFLLLYQLFKMRNGSSGLTRSLLWPTPQTLSTLPHTRISGETSLNFLFLAVAPW